MKRQESSSQSSSPAGPPSPGTSLLPSSAAIVDNTSDADDDRNGKDKHHGSPLDSFHRWTARHGKSAVMATAALLLSVFFIPPAKMAWRAMSPPPEAGGAAESIVYENKDAIPEINSLPKLIYEKDRNKIRCHRLTSSAQNYSLPEVLLVGVMKSGTTAVAEWLFAGGMNRPRRFEDEPSWFGKEQHFFDNHFDKGVDFYRRHFPCHGLSMDATPNYIQYAKRIRKTYEADGKADAVKIILIFRDPVEMLLSLYNHAANHMRTGNNEVKFFEKEFLQSFDGFVRDFAIRVFEDEDYNEWGAESVRTLWYDVWLKEWFDLFSRNQILVLSYDELQRDPLKLRQRIQNFLGVRLSNQANSTIVVHNAKDDPKKVKAASPETSRLLVNSLGPHIKQFYEILDAHPGPPMEQRPFPRFKIFKHVA